MTDVDVMVTTVANYVWQIAAVTLASGTLTIYTHIHSSVPWEHLVSIANYYMQPLIRMAQMHTTQTSYLRMCSIFRYPSGQSHIHIMQWTQLYMWMVPMYLCIRDVFPTPASPKMMTLPEVLQKLHMKGKESTLCTLN